MEKKTRLSTDEIIAMYNNGMTQTDIANATGISQSTIGFRLRRAGIYAGRGKRNPNKGGEVADTIPSVEYKVADEAVNTEEVQKMAEKNAANACLVVGNSVVMLEGQIGSYEVSRKKRTARMAINDNTLELSFEQAMAIVEEFRALARGLVNMDAATPEMW